MAQPGMPPDSGGSLPMFKNVENGVFVVDSGGVGDNDVVCIDV